MTAGYKIKEVSERSGFSAATLRYYEEIGLLPESSRTHAGYRVYDDASLDRLAFITRAKQLGCTLDEIADLTVAWEGGRCGPVQDRLRALVADKLASSQRQIVELMTLSSDLHRAAATLELHRPDGPCDDRCGCTTSDATESTSPQPISLVSKPPASEDIACTLPRQSMRGRLEEWQGLLRHVARRDPIAGGLQVTFGPSAPLEELMRLTAAEQACCQSFQFAITVDTRGIALEVRAPADALSIVDSLFGVVS